MRRLQRHRKVRGLQRNRQTTRCSPCRRIQTESSERRSGVLALWRQREVHIVPRIWNSGAGIRRRGIIIPIRLTHRLNRPPRSRFVGDGFIRNGLLKLLDFLIMTALSVLKFFADPYQFCDRTSASALTVCHAQSLAR